MRYSELIEASDSDSSSTAAKVWKQTEKTHDALRKLRAKQAEVAADRTAARALPAGPARTKRVQAADQHDAEARRVYGDRIKQANDAMRSALSKRTD